MAAAAARSRGAVLAQAAAALRGREVAAALRGREAAPWVEQEDEAGGGAA